MPWCRRNRQTRHSYFVPERTNPLLSPVDCFVESDFLVYFKFQKTGNEPNAFFNNTKAEEYRLKFEEGAAGYFGNVYDINGCHLYKLSNGGQRVNNTDQEGKEGGTTIPVHVLAKTIPVHIKELAVEG